MNFELTVLPGNFAKIQINGQTRVRVHALVDGSWVSGGADPRKFTDEAAALSWLHAQAIVEAVKAVFA